MSLSVGEAVRITRTGEEGTVCTVLTGSMTGQVEVRLEHYTVCVPLEDLEIQQEAPTAAMAALGADGGSAGSTISPTTIAAFAAAGAFG